MATSYLILNNPTLKVALTEAALTTGQAVECQVNSAVAAATATYATVPSTGCSGATQSPGLESWALTITWLQDWHKPAAESLSWFAFNNSGKPAWFEYTPNADDPTTKMTGEAFYVAGDFGGVFGDGSAAQATQTWPLTGKPTIVGPVAAGAAAEGEQVAA